MGEKTTYHSDILISIAPLSRQVFLDPFWPDDILRWRDKCQIERHFF